jgi:hypothetical protein
MANYDPYMGFLPGDQYPGGGSGDPYQGLTLAETPGRIKTQPVPTYPQPVPTGQTSESGGWNGGPPNQAGFNPSTLTAEYQSALGRSGRPDEINQYLPAVQQYGWDAVKNQIDTSPEAQQFKQSGVARYNGTNVFDDPATKSYEDFLNQLVTKFNTPYKPSTFDSTLQALQQYIGRLNGPAYTPDQLNLLQTQVYDPLMSQRDAEEQNIIRRFAAQGIGPSSGPVQQAILQNRQKYEQLGTQARAGVATNAIGLQNQNQANAIGLQTQLPQLETNLNSYNLGNTQQAANYAGIVPNLAWQRVNAPTAAPQNAAALIQQLLTAQQQGQASGSQFSYELQQALPYLLKIFGIK